MRPAYTGAGARGFNKGLHSKPDGRWRTCKFFTIFKKSLNLAFFFFFSSLILNIFFVCCYWIFIPKLTLHLNYFTLEWRFKRCFWGKCKSYVSVGREEVSCV